MKKLLILLIAAIGVLLYFNGPVFSATQTINWQVANIQAFSVSGNPGDLVVDTATAGSEPDDDTDSSTTFNISSNVSNSKITGQITTGGDMPSYVTLKCLLQTALSGTPTEQSLVSSTAKDLMTGIGKGKATGKTITYTLSATLDAEPASGQKTVTLTLTSG